jgi:hypothetical protein
LGEKCFNSLTGNKFQDSPSVLYPRRDQLSSFQLSTRQALRTVSSEEDGTQLKSVQEQYSSGLRRKQEELPLTS